MFEKHLCCNSFSTSFLLHQNKVNLSYSYLFSFQPKERKIVSTYYIYKKKKATLKRECARSCVREAYLLGFYIMHKVEIEGVFLVFFVMFSTLFLPLLIIRKEGIGMLGHIINLSKYQLIGET